MIVTVYTCPKTGQLRTVTASSHGKFAFGEGLDACNK